MNDKNNKPLVIGDTVKASLGKQFITGVVTALDEAQGRVAVSSKVKGHNEFTIEASAVEITAIKDKANRRAR